MGARRGRRRWAPPTPPPARAFPSCHLQGAYSAILAGAAFMDSAALFPLYSSPALAPARALVDALFNCDDLLLNYVAANATRAASAAAAAAAAHKGGQAAGGAAAEELQWPARLVRPQRRLDLSRLSGVGERWPACGRLAELF